MFSASDNANNLMVQAATAGIDSLAGFNDSTTLSGSSWLSDPVKVEHVHELRIMALSNAKILYGSEKFKFFDVVVAYSEPEAKFAAILVCSFNEATKILRKEVATCPVAAVRAIVYGLHVDTGLLLTKYDVGDQLFGQQGGTQRDSVYVLHEWKRAISDEIQDQDDTSTLLRGNLSIPTGPRSNRTSIKRTRFETNGGDYCSPRGSDSLESEGRLKYED